MLVLRRRPCESIAFDGGLKITLTGLQDQRAWLGFSAPCLATAVNLSVLAVGEDHVCVGIAGPAGLGAPGSALEVTPAERDDVVLLVNRRVGESLVFPDLTVDIAAIEAERAVLGLDLESVAGRVLISVFPATGGEVKIGIEAPREVRVFREEIWRELEAANTGAGEGWSDSDLASLSTTRPPQ